MNSSKVDTSSIRDHEIEAIDRFSASDDIASIISVVSTHNPWHLGVPAHVRITAERLTVVLQCESDLMQVSFDDRGCSSITLHHRGLPRAIEMRGARPPGPLDIRRSDAVSAFAQTVAASSRPLPSVDQVVEIDDSLMYEASDPFVPPVRFSVWALAPMASGTVPNGHDDILVRRRLAYPKRYSFDLGVSLAGRRWANDALDEMERFGA